MKKLEIIINADDFGFNKTISEAIMDSFNSEYITTTTACSNGEYFNEAISIIKNSPFFDKIGLHINLTEGKPLTDSMKNNQLFCDTNGQFSMFNERYRRLSRKDKADIYNEICAQIEAFQATGLKIHHIDSHHHIHNALNIFPIFLKACRTHKIEKIRIFSNASTKTLSKKVYKSFFNLILKKYSYSDYMGSFDDLKGFSKTGKFELMVHPDYMEDTKSIVDRDPESDYQNPYGESMKDVASFVRDLRL